MFNVKKNAYGSRSNKFGARRQVVEGISFDSTKEARRYTELRALERAGKIYELQLQVPFELVPAQREPDTVGVRGGIKRGRVIEKAVNYYADFVYTNERGELIVEDAKSPVTRTKDYIIKRKLMLAVHSIRVREV